MSQNIRWGILGAGKIAKKFASDLRLVKDAELIAIGSRNIDTAQVFARDYPAKYLHGSYEDLVSNPEVDTIYVATTHNFHYEHTMLCLQNGKAVLCEKPFAINAREASAMIALAKEKNIFLMEALWTKFLPHFIKVKELVASGQIGEVKSVLVKFGFKPTEPIAPRIFDPALAGGTMLDIGIYNVFMALGILGKPTEIEAIMTPASTGIDEQCAVTFRYWNGALAQLFSSFASNIATEADIHGSNGRIRLAHRFYAPDTTIEYYPGWIDSKEVIPVEKEAGWGYQYQIRHVCDCLRSGLTESPVMSFADTMLLIETLDAIRAKAGISYEADKVV
ncbi:Gfo/Idh/MocA family oxidoreductase [Panacibacter ginsenosidivorans]|uniref:Gfo/Idh/MocA family oxidoreductase n=1 Tax=Panacibacter ginsenosidivorans TaxID=1813871 RepID=A0A5B8VH14_9BACT|nr:Gfo/Idh/MocA family oxidoreductase [Panacibacter ginsenosidivorans]QEC69598.1 Gfo/Idh/MocA family oxidoreductase [Panacibacter ginsenosidivorans]